jgi:hypothetical protein
MNTGDQPGRSPGFSPRGPDALERLVADTGTAIEFGALDSPKNRETGYDSS